MAVLETYKKILFAQVIVDVVNANLGPNLLHAVVPVSIRTPKVRAVGQLTRHLKGSLDRVLGVLDVLSVLPNQVSSEIV